MKALILGMLLGGFSAVALAQSAAGSGANHGTASPGGNPGAGAASGPVVSPSRDASTAGKPEGIVRRGALLYVVSHGEELRLEGELQLSGGITVDRLGNVTLKDGRKVELRDGQMVRPDGQVVERPR